MANRIVTDPSQHGWVLENGKWVWNASGGGGGAGAGMVISETEPTDKVEGMQWLNPTNGLVLFWDGEKWLEMPGGKDGADGAGNIADATQQGVIATWDDTANQWTPSSAVIVGANEVVTVSGDATGSSSYVSNFVYSNPDPSGTIGILVNSQYGQAGFGTFGNYPAMLYRKNNAWSASCYHDTNVDDFNINATRLLVNGVPKIGTTELIETLSTLREATKDETTIKGLRDAIGNAVGGLIEKFEAMQADAEEVADE